MMRSVFSIWLVQCIILLFGFSLAVQGIPIESIQQPSPGGPIQAQLQQLPSILVASDFPPPTIDRPTSIETPISTDHTSIISTSSQDSTSTSLTSSKSSTGFSTHTLSSSSVTSNSISLNSIRSTSFRSVSIRSTSSAPGTETSTSTTKTTSSFIKSDATTADTISTPSTISHSSSKDRKTLIIALSVTFSILGIIFIILTTILVLQCTKSSSHYERFRLRNFPFSRGGATPLSDNEIASWREKPNLSPPGVSAPTPYTNLIQRYSRPLSLTRPLNINNAQTSVRNSGYGSGLVRPAVPPKLVLTGGNNIRTKKRENGHGKTNSNSSNINGLSFITMKDREKASQQRSVPLPPIARAPNSRPGLTDESLPGTPAFILPTHPRRVSRKLSKINREHNHNSPFSPRQSVTSPNTPRPSTSGMRKGVGIGPGGKAVLRRSSMPGLNKSVYRSGEGIGMSRNAKGEWKYEEDQVIQRGNCDAQAGGAHCRSRSDMTPFKEAMEGRSRPSCGGVRPSFEESIGRIREENPS